LNEAFTFEKKISMETLSEKNESFETKIAKILSHLQTHGQITSWEAISKYRCSRLAAVVFVLKSRGHSITTERVTENKSNYAIYHFHKSNF
jgi:hypothetical protein